MKKNRIRLTESSLHRIIKESVKRVLNEIENDSLYCDPRADRDKNQEYINFDELDYSDPDDVEDYWPVDLSDGDLYR